MLSPTAIACSKPCSWRSLFQPSLLSIGDPAARQGSSALGLQYLSCDVRCLPVHLQHDSPPYTIKKNSKEAAILLVSALVGRTDTARSFDADIYLECACSRHHRPTSPL